MQSKEYIALLLGLHYKVFMEKKKYPQLVVRINESLLAEIEEGARKSGQKKSAYIRMILKRGLR